MALLAPIPLLPSQAWYWWWWCLCAAALAPTAGIDRTRFSLSFVANVCFRYFNRFKGMMQLFFIDVVKVDQGMLHMLYMLQVF
jgi:hypothetical protein